MEGPLDADTIFCFPMNMRFILKAIQKTKLPTRMDAVDTFYGVNGEYGRPFIVEIEVVYMGSRSQMVALPYGDRQYSMIVLLPKPGHTSHGAQQPYARSVGKVDGGVGGAAGLRLNCPSSAWNTTSI